MAKRLHLSTDCSRYDRNGLHAMGRGWFWTLQGRQGPAAAVGGARGFPELEFFRRWAQGHMQASA